MNYEHHRTSSWKLVKEMENEGWELVTVCLENGYDFSGNVFYLKKEKPKP